MNKFQSLIIGVMFGVSVFSVSTSTALTYSSGNITASVVDPATGYKWTNGVSGKMTYAAAEKFCSALVLDGETDWRMPTKPELSTLYIIYSSGNLSLSNYITKWSSTAGVIYPDRVQVVGSTGEVSEVSKYSLLASNGVQCIADFDTSVVIPTTGYYKFRVVSGNGVVSVDVNGVKALTVDTQFEQGEVAIGSLLEGEVITITTNDLGAASIVEEQLPEFPFVRWNYSFLGGAVELVLYDPLPEATVCEVTPADLDDVQSQLNLCKETVTYTEGILVTAQGQIALCNSDKAVVEGKLAESVAKVAELNQAVTDASAQIASLQAQLLVANKSSTDANAQVAVLQGQLAITNTSLDTCLADDGNNGHGNDLGKVDLSNPGKSKK